MESFNEAVDGFSERFQDFMQSMSSLLKPTTSRATATTVVLGGVLMIALMVALFKEDLSSSMSFSPLSAAHSCADTRDVLNVGTDKCEANNPWVLAFLRREGWASCPGDMAGLHILAANQDSVGRYWYPVSATPEVKGLYQSCFPVCATVEDEYDSKTGMCHVRNEAAIIWMLGEGQWCSNTHRGAAILSSQSKKGLGLTYPPSESDTMRDFYTTCTTSCAMGDGLSADGNHCIVANSDALSYLTSGIGSCDGRGEGLQSIGHTQDVGFYYPKQHGAVVEAWYLTCKQAKSQAGSAAHSSMMSGVTAPPTTIFFPYPSSVSLNSVVICNYSGKKYYYEGKVEGVKHAVEPVELDGECTSFPLSDACQDNICWNRGTVAPCKSAHCHTTSATDVNAGIVVVPGGGAGRSDCHALCTAAQAQCETATLVIIAPAHCATVQILPMLISQLDATLDFPKPFTNLPKVTFPYPLNPDATSIFICNYSGQDFWFSTDDSTQTAWENAAGHMLVKPISRGGSCAVITTGESTWTRGYIAPCDAGETECKKSKGAEVHAGVNVINGEAEGVALCSVECHAAADMCQTATVVFLSPVKCDRVHVTTK
mmetsp:Transcript_66278/g.138138  ORF Transcript_66278/g.138138 Transcript_66278/m.138138 type:complete len:598 (-) Transcript_66278:79-1872(-)